MLGHEIIVEVHNALRRLNGVTPPREFVLMQRAAIVLGSVLMHLRAQANWHQLFHEMIADFEVGALAARQRAALQNTGLSQ